MSAAYPSQSLVDLLRTQADRAPTSIALLELARTPRTYGQLIRNIDDARRHAGRRVAIVIPDGLEMVTAFLSVSAGATCLPLNPALRAPELERVFARMSPDVLLVPAGSASPAIAVARARGIPIVEPGAAGDGTRGTARADDPILILETSGTTAEPKQVVLTHRNVIAAARAIADVLELTAADRCLSVMPLFHIHGLSAIIATLTTGGSVICPPSFSAEAFFDWLDELRPTWFTAAPSIHRAIVDEARRHPGHAARSSLRFIRSASSAMPRELAHELEDLFGVPFIEAYGMTEAGPQIASNRLPPHVRKPGSVGRAAGPEIAIVDGEIAIRGENVCTSDWLRTGDLGYLDEDGHLFVTGRVKDVINRGGEKIAPREIEETLLSHDAIREAAVFGAPHPTLGEGVVAAVVLKPGASITASAIRRYVAERVAPFKVPHPILIVDAIPTTPSGKLQRSRLAAEFAAPVNELEARVLAIFAEVLQAPIGVHDDFFLAGGDSLSATRVIARLNHAFGTDLPPDALFEHPTPHDLTPLLVIPSVSEGPGRSGGRNIEPPTMTSGQQRLWLLDQLDPGNPAYNMQVALRWSGALDVPALEQRLSEIRNRHDVLRTTFPMHDGQPFARVLDPAPLRLPVVSLTHVTDQESELRRLAAEERARPFHLGREMLFRSLLIQLDAANHVLLLTMHHIVSDGWSISVLIRELGASTLPELPMRYADFAAWQRQMLDDGGRETQLAYWRDALADVRSALDLPTDRPRPTEPTHGGAAWVAAIDRDTTARLKALSRGEGATLFMTILAAFQTLLFRYSGQEDIAVGTPVANRTHPATEALIGFFANTLVMRGDLSGDPSFLALLRRVMRIARGAFAHQAVPFEEVVDAIRPQRHAGRTPLFEVMFAFQNYPGASGAITPDLELASHGASAAKFDLTLYVSETADGLRTQWQYSTDLFDEATIDRMAAAFGVLLEGIATDPHCRLSALPLLAHAVEPAIPNDAAPPDFSALFDSHVRQTPDAIAVRCGHDALTYRELDARAAAFADRLRLSGVRAGMLVGVAMSRSVNALVALLGVWKAGGAYLPIDPAYPDARKAFMLDDARVAALVSDTDEIVLRDGDGIAVPDLAYVIYTSGSTGPPKGVMISHRNIAHYVAAMRDTLGIDASDRYLHTASFAFSSAMRQFLLPLACGATVVIASSDELRDPLALLERVKRERVTVADLVPSYWRHLVRQLASDQRPSLLDNDLRLLLSASETLLSDLPAQWTAFGQRARLVNMYGQTETTGIVATHPIGTFSDVQRVPVGKPIPGTTACILDSVGRPVPDGVIGELVISGPTVGLGYLGRPEETANRFGARGYRTGDLARRLADGTLVLLGRIDGQVKLRGFRIEPGEVEAAIKSDSRVDDCAVVVRDDRLIAFVTSRHPIASSLRTALKSRLPEYLVPSLIVPIESLPLTPTGKLNRAALVVEEHGRPARSHRASRPVTSSEAILSELWSRMLGVENLRPDDNFFDLGGDSLTGIRMIDEANRAGLALKPKDLFQHQTLRALAASCHAEGGRGISFGGGSLDVARDDARGRITLESARMFGEEALMRAGLSREHAAAMTDVQIEASLRGQPTHNIGAIPRYARRLGSGATNPRFELRIVRETAVSALLDGDNGPGQLIALKAMDIAIRKAEANGIGVAGVRHSNHFGAAGHYVWQAARRGFIGLCTTNSALWLAPAGGLTPLFGTNPLGAGIPSKRHHPIILDASMSVTAKGKVALQLAEGRALPPGWILDRAGRPSIDPADLVAGLGIPIGGHKGYGLALVMEVLAGVLTGAGFASDHRRERLKRADMPADFGHFFIAIDPELFLSRSEFSSRVDRLIGEVKEAKQMDGVEEILLPGEAELRAREENLRDGSIPLAASVREALEKYRREAGLRTELVMAEQVCSR